MPELVYANDSMLNPFSLGTLETRDKNKDGSLVPHQKTTLHTLKLQKHEKMQDFGFTTEVGSCLAQC